MSDLCRRTTTVLAHAGAAIGCLGTIAVSGMGGARASAAMPRGIVPADVRDPRQPDLLVAEPLR